MSEFMIRFFLCNILISIIIVILLTAKHFLKNRLTNRMHYTLWFLLLGLLALPFLPSGPGRFLRHFPWALPFRHMAVSPTASITGKSPVSGSSGSAWMNDISISIGRKAPSTVGMILFFLWIAGIAGMSVLVIRSVLRFRTLKKSALPLQNAVIRRLYRDCLKEAHIKRNIPVYSTAFLRSPVMTGLFRPRIYLPIRLLADCSAADIRYILLHELQHYKYKDALANYMMNLAGMVYWFNPFVWHALKEMKHDREVACDTSVLKLLETNAYADYGNTLISFAEKVSREVFPFAAGIGGNMRQMKKRVINIATYHPDSFRKNLYSSFAWLMIAFLLSGFVPLLSIRAADDSHYDFEERGRSVTYLDLSDTFQETDGCFVLYDSSADTWKIYNKDLAATRMPPASTFKIYSALFSLESGIITPAQSSIPWDGQHYVYDTWNADQTLESAMQNSVTWYFQALDQKSNLSDIKHYIRETGYGNQLVEGGLSSYWLNASLKISPVEQVEMLKKLYDNQFGFSPQNIETVKRAIRLSSTDDGTLYGKTGTEEVDGKNTSGWFIGYIEKDGHTCFFATNIQNENGADGPAAAELTFSVLSDLHLWHAAEEEKAVG